MGNEFQAEIWVFYNHSSWHKFLNDFVRKSFSRLLATADDLTFSISFCFQRGDHLKLVLHSPQNLIKRRDKLEFELNRFLMENPSENTRSNDFPISGLFKNFDNNSFLITRAREYPRSSAYSSFSVQLSNCIVDAFSYEQHCDLNLLLSVMIYLQLGLVQSVFPEIYEAAKKIHSTGAQLSVNKHKSNVSNGIEYFSSSFLLGEDKNIINEIIIDLWKGENIADLNWLYDWQKTIKTYIDVRTFDTNYYILSNTIYTHFGFDETQHSFGTFFNIIKEQLMFISISGVLSAERE